MDCTKWVKEWKGEKWKIHETIGAENQNLSKKNIQRVAQWLGSKHSVFSERVILEHLPAISEYCSINDVAIHDFRLHRELEHLESI